MASLAHYDSGEIYINGSKYSFDDFLKLQPSYCVPFGFHIRVYEKGVKHYISDGANTLYLDKDDPYCNEICNRQGELARLVALLKSEQE
jgi:hypothetical protein